VGTHHQSRQKLAHLLDALGPGPWDREQLRARGWSDGQLERAVARGDLVRVRRGLYVVRDAAAVAHQLAIPYDAYRARLTGFARSLPGTAVFSHSSAAYLSGLWDPFPRSPMVHVTEPGRSGRADGVLRVHGAALPPEHVTVVGGLRCTSVPRTAADLARAGDLPAALVVMDGAVRCLLGRRTPGLTRRLRAGTVSAAAIEEARAELARVGEVVGRWPGGRTVLAGIAAADPRSESPFESWSRGWMLTVGLPRPALNAVVLGRSGRRYLGDFVWRDHGLIGEADGVGKYGSTGPEIRAALRDERARQADLEAAGWRVVRWVTGDAGAQIVGRIGRALYLDAPSTTEAPGKSA
jgi:hypothetical protein